MSTKNMYVSSLLEKMYGVVFVFLSNFVRPTNTTFRKPFGYIRTRVSTREIFLPQGHSHPFRYDSIVRTRVFLGASYCCVWSTAGTIILIFLGILVDTQPEFIVTLDKDIVKDSHGAAGHLYGAAAIYAVLAIVSIGYLHREENCRSLLDTPCEESRPLLGRFDDDEEHESETKRPYGAVASAGAAKLKGTII